jgi:coenzyme F420 hydrogenase subunit beta
MRSSSPEALKKNIQDQNLCVNCGACTEICPYFKSYKGRIAMIFSCPLEQGRCHAQCPKGEIDLEALSLFFHGKPPDESPLGPYHSITISRSGEKMNGGLYQNGGTVSALTAVALLSGRIETAILTGKNGVVPEYRLVNTLEEIQECATSKYLASPTLGGLNKAMNNGLRKIGVVGTPCQMRGAALIRMNPMKKEDFKDPVTLSIGLFCTWALDGREVLSYLSSRMDVTEIRRMDIPPPPAKLLIIEKESGLVEIPLEEIRPFILKGCGTCPDMTSELSDISVGAFEENPEWNTLIIRTEAGAALVEEARKKGYLTTQPMPEEALSHLLLGAAMKKKRSTSSGSEELCPK